MSENWKCLRQVLMCSILHSSDGGAKEQEGPKGSKMRCSSNDCSLKRLTVKMAIPLWSWPVASTLSSCMWWFGLNMTLILIFLFLFHRGDSYSAPTASRNWVRTEEACRRRGSSCQRWLHRLIISLRDYHLTLVHRYITSRVPEILQKRTWKCK